MQPTLNPAGNATGGVPVDDRQWLEFHGKNTVYLLYRTIAPTIAMVQRSDDGGFTYGPATVVGAIGQVGYLDVHQASGRGLRERQHGPGLCRKANSTEHRAFFLHVHAGRGD